MELSWQSLCTTCDGCAPAWKQHKESGDTSPANCAVTEPAGLNFTFSVHPTGFVVHVPHARSLTQRVTRSTEHWAQVGVPSVSHPTQQAMLGMGPSPMVPASSKCMLEPVIRQLCTCSLQCVAGSVHADACTIC